MNDSRKKRKFLYVIPEEILFDEDLTINDLRVYSLIRSFADSETGIYEGNNLFEEMLDVDNDKVKLSISRLIEKRYILSNEGYFCPNNVYLLYITK